MYIEGIIERLNNPHLHNTTNPGRKVLDGTIGEYLEHYNNHFLDLWLCKATGGFLDVIGEQYGVIRQDDETDDSYRKRIQLDVSIVDSSSDIRKAGVELYVKTTGDFGDKWTSDNLYLGHEEYFAVADDEAEDYISKKFIVEDITWVS